MRYLAALLISLLPFAIRADDKKPTHDELLIQAWEKGPASAEEYLTAIRRAIRAATQARLVIDAEPMLVETQYIDEGTFLTLTDCSMLLDLLDQLEFDTTKLPKRDPENPKARIVHAVCLCSPEFTVVLYRNSEMIAAFGLSHATHMQAQDYTDRVEFPELSGSSSYILTQASTEKVRGWEKKYRIKELMKAFFAARAPAKEQETK